MNQSNNKDSFFHILNKAVSSPVSLREHTEIDNHIEKQNYFRKSINASMKQHHKSSNTKDTI